MRLNTNLGNHVSVTAQVDTPVMSYEDKDDDKDTCLDIINVELIKRYPITTQQHDLKQLVQNPSVTGDRLYQTKQARKMTNSPKLDTVHGYFQLGLDKESSKVTTFILLQGKFRYLRAPMGLNASSNKWCCQSDVLIQGIPWARKLWTTP